MKKIIAVTLAACIVLSLSIATAVPVLANDIASSTLHFEGALTDDGGGEYSGVIAATAGTYYVEGGAGVTDGKTPDGRDAVGGFDVYAKEGADAYYDNVVQGTIGSDHDAYSSAGGWGAWWDPDVPDWGMYGLVLGSDDTWKVVYNHLGEWATAGGVPMSGTISWHGDGTGYATETDTGAYFGSYAVSGNLGGAAANGGGPQAWDMDWEWGSEAIPLQYPGYTIEVTDLGGGNYHVTLTPSGNSVSVTTNISAPLMSIAVTPATINFGNLNAGQTSSAVTMTIENLGSVAVAVTAEAQGTDAVFYTDNLTLDSTALSSWSIASIAVSSSDTADAVLTVPGTTAPGVKEATLVFWAEAATP